jgi:hypothetical protein
MTNYDYFTRAEQIELICADIYARLATDFEDTPEVSATFRKLAQEEQQHAARIRLMQNQYRASPGLFTRMERLEAELSALEREAARLRDEVMRGAWGNDIATVHQRLVEMEDRLHLHAETMARSADPRVRDFFEALARQDEAHRQLCAVAGGTPARPGAAAAGPRSRR